MSTSLGVRSSPNYPLPARVSWHIGSSGRFFRSTIWRIRSVYCFLVILFCRRVFSPQPEERMGRFIPSLADWPLPSELSCMSGPAREFKSTTAQGDRQCDTISSHNRVVSLTGSGQKTPQMLFFLSGKWKWKKESGLYFLNFGNSVKSIWRTLWTKKKIIIN